MSEEKKKRSSSHSKKRVEKKKPEEVKAEEEVKSDEVKSEAAVVDASDASQKKVNAKSEKKPKKESGKEDKKKASKPAKAADETSDSKKTEAAKESTDSNKKAEKPAASKVVEEEEKKPKKKSSSSAKESLTSSKSSSKKEVVEQKKATKEKEDQKKQEPAEEIKTDGKKAAKKEEDKKKQKQKKQEPAEEPETVEKKDASKEESDEEVEEENADDLPAAAAPDSKKTTKKSSDTKLSVPAAAATETTEDDGAASSSRPARTPRNKGKGKTPRERSAKWREGKVYFQIMAARGLKKGKYYCTYKFGTEGGKTESIKSPEPAWSKNGRLYLIPETGEPDIVIQLFSRGLVGLLDDLVGELYFSLNDVFDGVPRDEYLPLGDRDGKEATKNKGELRVQIMFVPAEVDMTGKGHEFEYPLQTLLRKDLLEPFSLLLSEGKTDVNKAFSDGVTALHVAAEKNQADAITHLLEHGASIEAQDEKGFTPLHYAAKFDSGAAAAVLCKAKDVKLDAVDNDDASPLMVCAQHNAVQAAKVLLEHKANVNHQDELGESPLHKALEAKADGIIELLVKNGANLYLEDNNSRTPASMILDPDVPLKASRRLMDAAGVTDHREFALRQKLGQTSVEDRKGHVVMNGQLDITWEKNPQFSLTSPVDTTAYILAHVHHDHNKDNQMEDIGLLVLREVQDHHACVSFKQHLIGYASAEPYELEMKAGEKFTLIPYAKREQAHSFMFWLLAYSKDKSVVSKKLPCWKHKVMAAGEWKGRRAAGDKNNTNWAKNPKVKVELPKGVKDFQFAVVLEQPNTPLDLNPYNVVPYAHHIGFYIYDKDMAEMVAESTFRNAKEVVGVFTVDTTKRNRVLVIPCTHSAGVEMPFTLHFYSDEEIKIA
mmetsp:Transcript_49885/g.125383  ORF Transcript_49885/g.125383 Transcript_49885/m.125383 type:complete len:884 (+) Transcript_49885:151-2802(+)|eukprot:CAMPEP_0177683174 /NCGR_PEP_ID=MMETSP0447-20121125/31647_1 /TAXON_ID=0 /ORGANISM="Stygamoeba regulata, Strain BSH-02190019" /LENGTH=883 /DNA_ID=CAMNT_0019192717 /DNA_START=90 /DNA_END=2741 /DNA_ORIENTATION=-